MLEKIKKISYKAILIILLVLMVYVTYCSIYKIYDATEILQPFVIIIGIIVMSMFFVKINKKINTLTKNQIMIMAIIICILFFGAMTIWGMNFKSMPYFDLDQIIGEADLMLKNGGHIETKEYFAKYANQIPLMLLVFYINKIGSFLKIPNLLIITNSMFIAVTAFFVFMTSKKLKGDKFGLLTLIFFVINPIFYLYASYYYTDTLCMPFAIISIYLFICANESHNIKNRVILSVISGLVLAFGFKIRVVVGIVLIGIMLAVFFQKKEVKSRIIILIFMLLGFLCGLLSYKIIAKNFETVRNKDLEFPPTHWIMMSVNEKTDGRFNNDDYNYTFNAGNYEKKIEKNVKRTILRIKNMGLSRLFELQKKKLEVNWSNGDYEFNNKFYDIEEMNDLYEFIVGNRKVFLIYYLQICKAVLYVMFTIAIIDEIRKEKNYKFIFISVFGFFLFYMIWEVGRRYSLSCMPIMILLFSIGIERLEQVLKIKQIKLEADKIKIIDLKKAIRYVCITILISTIGLLVINADKYCIHKNIEYDKVAMQLNSYNTYNDIANNEIEQEFIADKKFNSVSIKFTKNNKKKNNKYNFILTDENGNELVKKEFYSDSVKNREYKTFNFEYIQPRGITKYKIKLSAENNSEDYCLLGVRLYSDITKFDIYPEGNLIVNGEEYNGDIVFKVENKIERTYISKTLYLFLSIFIIVMEFYVFYPYIKKNVLRRKSE